jgi:nitronate monooxygenase
MPIPDRLVTSLDIPAVAAPMFLVSGPDLVVEVCRSGVIGTFPTLNQRTSEGYDDWLVQIEQRLDAVPERTAYGVNLIVHRSNTRLEADLAVTARHRVPLVITSLGARDDVVDAIHAYGGLVFHDVTNVRHAERAARAGVDGLIAVASGAGGHAGTSSAFGLVHEIRRMFAGTLVLAGAMSTGRDIAAARAMGADMAYVGTRFIATQESLASPAYKEMLVDSAMADIVYTPNLSGVGANFLRPSIRAAGLDPDDLPAHGDIDLSKEAKTWKNIWSAGHGVGTIATIPKAAALCASLADEYRSTMRELSNDRFMRAQ